MYLWIGINVDDELQELKQKVEAIYKNMNYYNEIINLPYHISLKISFEIDLDMKESIINDLSNYFKLVKPFTLETIGIENEGTICWLRYKENNSIQRIKKDINSMLYSKYQIPYHEYDLDFIFHSTLFMDDDINMVKNFYEMTKDFAYPRVVHINHFLIGESLNGDVGSFRIIKKI